VPKVFSNVELKNDAFCKVIDEMKMDEEQM
jgi:hypothetical protein